MNFSKYVKYVTEVQGKIWYCTKDYVWSGKNDSNMITMQYF